jgi:hypothetical protein
MWIAWYGNCTVCNCKALQRVLRSAQHITGGTVPALQDNYSTLCHRKAKKIIKDLSHLSHSLLNLLPSRRWRQYRCITAGTEKQLLSPGQQTVKTVTTSRPPSSTLP